MLATAVKVDGSDLSKSDFYKYLSISRWQLRPWSRRSQQRSVAGGLRWQSALRQEDSGVLHVEGVPSLCSVRRVCIVQSGRQPRWNVFQRHSDEDVAMNGSHHSFRPHPQSRHPRAVQHCCHRQQASRVRPPRFGRQRWHPLQNKPRSWSTRGTFKWPKQRQLDTCMPIWSKGIILQADDGAKWSQNTRDVSNPDEAATHRWVLIAANLVLL